VIFFIVNWWQLVQRKIEKKIEIDGKLHHSKAEESYDALKKDTDIGRLNSSIVVLCVDLQ